MTAALTASPAQAMADATVDAETTRLAVRARDGSAEAFCTLVDLHGRAARRVATVALGNAADAEEAVQDACLTAWQRIGQLEDPSSFRAWLLRITWRKALDRRRSLATLLKRVVGASGPTPRAHGAGGVQDDPVVGLADSRIPIDEALVNQERDRIIAQVIKSLPARLRDPFLLAAAGDHRYDDIAAMLGVPTGTVKWRVSEARRVLRDKLMRLGWG